LEKRRSASSLASRLCAHMSRHMVGYNVAGLST
jgi:hypothetical protein